MIVYLTPEEIADTIKCGEVRRSSSRAEGLVDNTHDPKSRLMRNEIIGAQGEMAYAKAMGLPWGYGLRTFKKPDVGGKQVRATDYVDGKLLIRPDDPEDHMFVLVICSAPTFNVVGEMRGRDAKQNRWIDEKHGPMAWMVPQRYLSPISFPSVDIFSSFSEIKEV